MDPIVVSRRARLSESDKSSSKTSRSRNKKSKKDSRDRKRQKSKSKKQRRRSSSSSSSSSSSDSSSSSSSSSSEDEKAARRRRKKAKKAKLKKKAKLEAKRIREASSASAEKKVHLVGPVIPVVTEAPEPDVGPHIDLKSSKIRAPMTKEEYEKQQNTLKWIVDPETGRRRLVRGAGEIVEEIVSKERHQAINKEATAADGQFFQTQSLSQARSNK